MSLREDSMNRAQLGYEFEKLCQRVFQFQGFTINTELMLPDQNGVRRETDIQFEKKELKGIAEVKLYSSRTISPKMVENAVTRFGHFDGMYGISLLIVSSVVTEPFKKQLLDQFGVYVWDIHDLFQLAFEDPDLYYELEQLYVQSTGESPAELAIIEKGKTAVILASLTAKPGKRPEPLHKTKTKGEELCEKLKNIRAGREADEDDDLAENDATKPQTPDKEFEETCIDILRYLFGRDLALWGDQHTTDAGIHRFDLICRIRSDHSFWRELAMDFNTRYVLFEFKNYTKKIKQEQIYTTEKYLFNKGYRTVAFIISKKGPDKNAIIAAKGALREQGKLIINLTDEDLCLMLKLFEGREEKDKKSDPTEILLQKIDDLLTKVIR